MSKESKELKEIDEQIRVLEEKKQKLLTQQFKVGHAYYSERDGLQEWSYIVTEPRGDGFYYGICVTQHGDDIDFWSDIEISCSDAVEISKEEFKKVLKDAFLKLTGERL
jgi:4-aminobutyrate aminotransferase-like enzyme